MSGYGALHDINPATWHREQAGTVKSGAKAFDATVLLWWIAIHTAQLLANAMALAGLTRRGGSSGQLRIDNSLASGNLVWR